MTTLILRQGGLKPVNYNDGELMVFLSGKPLSGSINQLPKSMGGGKYINFFRGNCSNATPFQFKSIELAIDAFKKIRWERNKTKENAKVFSGNYYIGNIIDDEFVKFEKPILQLL